MSEIKKSLVSPAIKGFKLTCIDWLVEEEDIADLISDNATEEEIEEAIDDFISENLPSEVFVPFKSSDIDEQMEKSTELDDWLSDNYGFLVKSFNYCMIGEDGKEYEFLQGN